MDGDVERLEPFSDHPGHVELGEASQRGEVAVEKRQPVIVVLEVQRGPHTRWQLIDEAELTVVVAGLHPIEDRRVEAQSQWHAVALNDLHDPLQATATHGELDVGFVDELLVLDDVGGSHAVDGHQLVADCDACFGSRAGGHYLENGRIGHGQPRIGRRHRRAPTMASWPEKCCWRLRAASVPASRWR